MCACIELGPGRGTLDGDALAGGQNRKDFHAAIVLHLVEISPKLEEAAAEAARQLGLPIVVARARSPTCRRPQHHCRQRVHRRAAGSPGVKQADGWHERVVEIASDGALAIGAAAESPLAHFERDAAARATAIAGRLDLRMAAGYDRARNRRDVMRNEGAALHDRLRSRPPHGLGDTLQAVAGHSYTQIPSKNAGRGRPHRARRFRWR
jgi:NADH dehydrogenase [ubiquinone] 1 alpha subcomplex assembly factor 7